MAAPVARDAFWGSISRTPGESKRASASTAETLTARKFP
ncbi:putative sortilin, partial [Toxoplasma gondii ARI]